MTCTYFRTFAIIGLNRKDMIIISPTDLRNEQKKYLELAETERVVVKRGNKLIHLVVTDRMISDEDLKKAISGKELKERIFKHIDTLFDEHNV